MQKPIAIVCNCDYLLTWQLGIGLLVLQNLSGINGVLFYASGIFKAAGKLHSLYLVFTFFLTEVGLISFRHDSLDTLQIYLELIMTTDNQ